MKFEKKNRVFVKKNKNWKTTQATEVYWIWWGWKYQLGKFTSVYKLYVYTSKVHTPCTFYFSGWPDPVHLGRAHRKLHTGTRSFSYSTPFPLLISFRGEVYSIRTSGYHGDATPLWGYTFGEGWVGYCTPYFGSTRPQILHMRFVGGDAPTGWKMSCTSAGSTW